jgi:hypothetical protein
MLFLRNICIISTEINSNKYMYGYLLIYFSILNKNSIFIIQKN